MKPGMPSFFQAYPMQVGRYWNWGLEAASWTGTSRSSLPKCSSAGMLNILNGQALPFASGSLRAIVMTDVMHHIPNVRLFFQEASRCVPPGGVISMIEPWVTAWSKFIYTHLHHEPFDPSAEEWAFPASGPLSGATTRCPGSCFSVTDCLPPRISDVEDHRYSPDDACAVSRLRRGFHVAINAGMVVQFLERCGKIS